ncbi:MAG: hypothetical protein HY089_13080 [Ignavibacteriales bacterium]|nr:hypothetical protein [Ignavibacteriales bacterium]
MVEINFTKCDEIITLLNTIILPPDKEDISIELENDAAQNFFFSLVAICHQTTPLNGPAFKGVFNGEPKKGWDALLFCLLKKTREDSAIVYPERLATLTLPKFTDILYDDNDKLEIHNKQERVDLLNDLGHYMLRNTYNTVADLYIKSEGYLVKDYNKGLLAEIVKINAYSDPIRKKTFFFLALMKNGGYWKYQDDKENLGAPVDYHEIRGHIRLGTITIKDELLVNKIRSFQPISKEEDLKIRGNVFQVIQYLSHKTSYTPSILHYFFWNLFRSCCSPSQTHCLSCPSNCSLPERYKDIIRGNKQCIFSSYCNSRDKEEKLNHYIFETDFY